MIDTAIFLVLCLISFALGWHTREIQILYYKLTVKKEPEPKVGVTLGSYASPKKEPSKRSNIVTPKTPEQLEFEKNQRENTISGSNENVGNIIERATHR
jgi:hypothetical protein